MSRAGRQVSARGVLLGLAVVLLAVNLRPGASSIGPVIAEVRDGLGMSPTVAGLLGALPGLCFAVFGALAAGLAARMGLTSTIAVGALAAAAGLLGRAVVGQVPGFLALSLLAFAGMAVGNVLVPAFVKRHFPNRLTLMTAAYSTGLAVGATVPAAVAAPVSHSLPGGWRASLGVWGLAAALAVVPWMVLALREQRGRSRSPRPPARSLWGVARSRKAVALAVFFGIQSMQAYVQFAWIAQMYRDGGLGQAPAGLMGSIIAAFGIPSGLLMPWVVHRFPDLRPFVTMLGVLLAAGYVGVLVAPTTVPWLWAVFLGASGAAFPLAIALITIRTRDARVTTRVSGFTQSVGYLMAGAGPFLIGALRDATDGWEVPLGLLALTGAAMVVAGYAAATPGYVDDEL